MVNNKAAYDASASCAAFVFFERLRATGWGTIALGSSYIYVDPTLQGRVDLSDDLAEGSRGLVRLCFAVAWL